ADDFPVCALCRRGSFEAPGPPQWYREDPTIVQVHRDVLVGHLDLVRPEPIERSLNAAPRNSLPHAPQHTVRELTGAAFVDVNAVADRKPRRRKIRFLFSGVRTMTRRLLVTLILAITASSLAHAVTAEELIAKN